MDEISLALNPPKFVKRRRPPIRLYRSDARVWPLATINGREPVILESEEKLRGIELAYPRVDASDAIANCPIGTPNGTATHIMPAMTRAMTIADGVISFAGRLGDAYAMIIDHGNGWASHYGNLDSICAIRTDLHRPHEQYVRAGDVIGYVGRLEGKKMKRLYFELWQADRSRIFVPIDPRPHLKDWKLVHTYDHFTPAPPVAQQKAA